jgi:hypothetical protein
MAVPNTGNEIDFAVHQTECVDCWSMTEESDQNQSASLSDSGISIIEGRLRADGLEGDIDFASGVGQPSRPRVHRVSGSER